MTVAGEEILLARQISRSLTGIETKSYEIATDINTANALLERLLSESKFVDTKSARTFAKAIEDFGKHTKELARYYETLAKFTETG
jgi:adenylate kinase family enzyme